MSEQSSRTFGDLASGGYLEFGDGYRTKRAEHGRPGLPILRVAEVLDGRIAPDFSDYVSDVHRPAMGGKISRPGDIVLTTKGTVGRVVLMPPDAPEFVYSPQTCYFRTPSDSPLLSRYLYYWFRGPSFRTQAAAIKSQTDMADYINLADIRSLRISIPPRSLQCAVVEILGALDEKIVVNDRIASTALELASTHVEAACADGARCRRVSLGESGRWYSGGTPRTSEHAYWGGDIPWISAVSLHSPWIDSSDRNVTRLGAEKGTRLVPAGSVIFVVRGMSLKSEFRVGITQQEVAFGQDCKAIITADEIDSLFLFLALWNRRDQILDLVDEAGHGTGRLQTDRIAQLMIPVPPDEEQRRIMELARPLADTAAKRQAENRVLAELRDTLLPGLISGELRIKDAERVVEDAV